MILPLPSLLYKSVRPKSRLVYFSHSSPFSFLANPLFRRLDVWKCIFRRLDVWKFRCLAILLASSAFLHQPSTTLWFLWFFANPPPLQPSNPLSFLTLCLSLRSLRALRETRPLNLFLTPSLEYAEYTEGECFCHDLEKD